jgi:hypothetical protein
MVFYIDFYLVVYPIMIINRFIQNSDQALGFFDFLIQETPHEHIFQSFRPRGAGHRLAKCLAHICPRLPKQAHQNHCTFPARNWP